MQRNISLAYFKAALHHLYFFVPIWYAFETQFVNPAILSVIYSMSHLITVVLELPTGALADLLGRKKTIFLGLILEGLSWVYLSQAQDASWLWTAYAFLGISAALVSGSDIALHYDSLKELEKERQYAKFKANIGLVIRSSTIVGTLLGGYLYSFNTRLPYFLVGTSVLVAGLLTLFNTEPRVDTEKFSPESYKKQTIKGFREIFKNNYIRDFSVYYVFVAGITWYFLYFLDQAFATEIGFTAIERSWVFSSIYLVAAFVNILFVRSSWLTRKRVYILLPFLMVLGFVPGHWAGKTIAIFSLLFVQLAALARFSLLDQYANLEFDSKYRATAVSALNMSVSLFFVIAASLSGTLITEFGSGFVMTLMGILTLVTAVPIAWLLIVRHKS